MTHREIGEVLGIRPGVAKLHVALARRALVDRLGDEVRT
jgi:DNA-directed RNA polymerase specialized sigma24 family protein